MRFTLLQKWYIKLMLIVIIVSFFVTNAYPQEVEKKETTKVEKMESKCALCDKVATGNFCSEDGTKVGSVLSSDPNNLLRNEVKIKRVQLANLRGFFSRERIELLEEKKLLDLQIKEMQNKINIHSLNLISPNSDYGFVGFTPDGKEIWFTPNGVYRTSK